MVLLEVLEVLEVHSHDQGERFWVPVMKYGLQSQAILLVREIYCFVLSSSISAYAEWLWIDSKFSASTT